MGWRSPLHDPPFHGSRSSTAHHYNHNGPANDDYDGGADDNCPTDHGPSGARRSSNNDGTSNPIPDCHCAKARFTPIEHQFGI